MTEEIFSAFRQMSFSNHFHIKICLKRHKLWLLFLNVKCLLCLLVLFFSLQSNWTILSYAEHQNILVLQQAYEKWQKLYIPYVTTLGLILYWQRCAHRVLINTLVLYTACMNKCTIIYSLHVWGIALVSNSSKKGRGRWYFTYVGYCCTTSFGVRC